MNLVEMKDLKVGYGKKVLIHGITLSVEEGKILTLIGPNGSGKSTILKTIIRQLKALGGAVYLNGKNQKDMSGNEIAKNLSMVMTEKLNPELMSCREVVATGRYPYLGTMGILSKEDWDRVEEAMATVRIWDIANKDFTRISDGQRQRVMLARALCQDTGVLIMDEPTSFLDIRYKLDILENIRAMAQMRKMAIILSLHELDLAMKVSDTIACVDGKEIVKIGTVEEVIQKGFIQKLYGVEENRFNPLTGSLYFKAAKGKPQIFVIGGNGSGITTYNRLQREQISFAAGILNENDMEYEMARTYSAVCIATKAFYPISDKEIMKAKELIDECESCICTLTEFGPLNEANKELREYARERGKLITTIG